MGKMKKNKDIKTKENTFIKYIKRLIKEVNNVDKSIMIIAMIRSLLSATIMYVGVYFGAIILDQLVAKEPIEEVLLSVYKLVFITGIVLLIRVVLNIIYQKKATVLSSLIDGKLVNQNTHMDYMQLEQKKTKAMLEEASAGANSSGGFQTGINIISDLLTNVFSIIYAFILISQLFIINADQENQTLNILFNRPTLIFVIIIVLAISSIINMVLTKKLIKANYEFFENNVEGNRIFSYMFTLAGNYNFGKDFRIYRMDKLIFKRMGEYDEKINVSYHKFELICAKINFLQTLVSGAVMLVAYTYVGMKALFGYISVGSVISAAASITFLNTALGTLISGLNYMKFSQYYIQKFLDYLDIKSEIYHGTLPIEKRTDNEFELRFENVSFHYPDNDEIILKNITYNLPLNKKLAIVGPNGAGKTTFIKLLCRLYDPTEGTIYLNGIDIKKYDYDEYVNLLSVVFQDFKLFSSTIAENVAGTDTYDPNRVKEVLETSGFKDRLQTLEEGINTQIYQKTEQGIEISGGEAQKIAIARALYKDAPIVILDEPTAALDPISEAEIYTKFSTLVKDKTAIYISHRMSSCKFCDNILVFNKGTIEEEGSHEDLLKKNGIYKKMWEAQADYYK